MANPIKIQATVSSIINHSNGVYSLVLNPLKRIPKYRPGQFLHFALDDYDPQGGFWPESRVFSIASYSSESIFLIYSVKGKYTERMSSELYEGKKVWLKLPYGDFVIDTSTETDQSVVLVAGGTGISPFVSYLQKEISCPSNRRIHLIYGVKNPALFQFSDILMDCKQKIHGFSMDIFIEETGNEALFLHTIKPAQGMIDINHVWKKGSELNNPVFFLSGPPGMIRYFKKELSGRGIGQSSIKIDEWE
jgi:ferredoxin-NADP reductase